MFRNVRFLSFTGLWPESESAVSEQLASAGFTPCGPLTEKTSGWEAPVDTDHPTLCRSVAGADLIQLRTQSRLLPTAAVNEAVEAKIEEFQARTGEPPGRREKRRMKLEMRDNLMPKALLRSERTRGVFLRSEHILAVDAGSPVKLERFLDSLTAAFDDFDTAPLDFRQAPGTLIQRIFMGDMPAGVTLGRECRMYDPSDSRSSVRFADMELTDKSVQRHVEQGLKLSHLEIGYKGLMSCVLDENGDLSKLRLAEADDSDIIDDEEALARFDAEFVLLTGTLREFLRVLR